MRDLRQPAAPRLLFAAALAASWALILALGSQLSYLNDDWDFLLLRPGFGAHQILDPHNPHIVVIPILIYKAVLAIFGMGSQQPFRVASTPLFLISVILLFAWLRRRVGDWLALAGVLPILFLGMAGEILLWPFPQIGFCGPMAAGLGAFLALERGDRRGDVLACALLTISVLFGSLGTAFVAGAVVHVAWDRDRWRRAYVAAIPAAVYVAWWLGWGHTAKSGTSLHNLLKSPIYVVEGFASGVSSLLGLPEVGLGGVSVDPGLPLLAGLIALAVIERRRLSGISRWLAVVTVTALGFWFPAALNASEQRAPTEPRYQYMAAIFFVMIAAELLRGVRVGRRALVVVLAIAGLATISNLVFLRQAFDDERLLGEQSRGALAGLEISRGVVDPEFALSPGNTGAQGLRLISAGPYFSAIDAYGSPAYSRSELGGAPEPARAVADRVIWNALAGGTDPGPARPDGPAPRVIRARDSATSPRGSCVSIAPVGDGTSVLALPPGGAMLQLSQVGVTSMRIRRFASQWLPLGTPSGGSPFELRIPPDRSSVPWRLQLSGSAPVRVCGIGSG